MKAQERVEKVKRMHSRPFTDFYEVRLRRPETISRFLSRIERTDYCWNWTHTKNKLGYGIFYLGHKVFPASRISFFLANGYLDEFLVVDHLCRNRCCVNPEHLDLIPNGENVLRGNCNAAQNSRKEFCKRGHPLVGGNLYHVLRNGRKNRNCKTCQDWQKTNKYRETIGLPPYPIERTEKRVLGTSVEQVLEGGDDGD